MRRTVTSPDQQHQAEFRFAGEIRFGPSYFSLTVDGYALVGRVFGDKALWSPDSRYLAVQEWLSTAEADGPQTALLCLDLLERRQCRVAKAAGGFITPLRFSDNLLIYRKCYFRADGERSIEYEIAFADLPRWEMLPG